METNSLTTRTALQHGPAQLLLAAAMLVLSGCNLYGPPPGEGEKAEHYYAMATPIIAALEDYHRANNRYPQHLSELKPDFLDQVNWQEQMYEPTDSGYELWFQYQGPGINGCIYRPNEGWTCSGMI